MPVNLWSEVAGHTCQARWVRKPCRNPATHIYGGIFICCQCHDIEGGGLVTSEDAVKFHKIELEGRI